MSYNTYSEERN